MRLIIRLLTFTLFVFIGGIFNIQNAHCANEQKTGIVEMKNERISVGVSRFDGSFSIRTEQGDFINGLDNNIPLLYPNLPTSFATVNINGKMIPFGDKSGKWVERPSQVGEKIIAVWEYKQTRVKQEFSFFKGLSTGKEDSFLLSYSITNTKKDSQVNAGIYLLYDVMVGNRDELEYCLPEKGPIEKETHLKGYRLPEFWYAYTKGKRQTASIQGLLRSPLLGIETFLPDGLVIGEWEDLIKNYYDSRLVNRQKIQNKNSSLLLYWNNRAIRNREYVFSTTFGIQNDSLASNKDLQGYLTSQKEVNGEFIAYLDLTSELSNFTTNTFDIRFRTTEKISVNIGPLYSKPSGSSTLHAFWSLSVKPFRWDTYENFIVDIYPVAQKTNMASLNTNESHSITNVEKAVPILSLNRQVKILKSDNVPIEPEKKETKTNVINNQFSDLKNNGKNTMRDIMLGMLTNTFDISAISNKTQSFSNRFPSSYYIKHKPIKIEPLDFIPLENSLD